MKVFVFALLVVAVSVTVTAQANDPEAILKQFLKTAGDAISDAAEELDNIPDVLDPSDLSNILSNLANQIDSLLNRVKA